MTGSPWARPSALGANGVDGVTAVASVLLLVATTVGVPPFSASQASSVPVQAAWDGPWVELSFSVPLFPFVLVEDERFFREWLAAFDLRRDGERIPVSDGRVGDGGSLRLVASTGAYPDSDVTVAFSGHRLVRDESGRPVPPFEAFPVRVTTAKGGLPSGRFHMAGGVVDGEILVIGGDVFHRGARSFLASSLGDVVRFDPAKGEGRILPRALPWNLSWPGHVFDERATDACPEGCFYLFGGSEEQGFNAHAPVVTHRGRDEVLRYDVAGSSTTVMDSRFPGPWVGATAIWTGTAAYVFGGEHWPRPDSSWDRHNEITDGIRRYDPATDSLVLLPTKLPYGLAHARAVWDPRETPDCPAGCAYLFAGRRTFGPLGDVTGSGQEGVIRFDPATEVAVRLVTAWDCPQAAEALAAAWTGSWALVTGSCERRPASWRFDPGPGLLTRIEVEHDQGDGALLLNAGGEIYLVGGLPYGDFASFDELSRLVTRLEVPGAELPERGGTHGRGRSG